MSNYRITNIVSPEFFTSGPANGANASVQDFEAVSYQIKEGRISFAPPVDHSRMAQG